MTPGASLAECTAATTGWPSPDACDSGSITTSSRPPPDLRQQPYSHELQLPYPGGSENASPIARSSSRCAVDPGGIIGGSGGSIMGAADPSADVIPDVGVGVIAHGRTVAS